jgi:oligosaccharide repeat unit polymerase
MSPSVITSGIWVFCLALFAILPHNLPPLSIQFLGSLSIWVTIICLSSLAIQSTSTKVSNIEPSTLVRDIFFWISILSFPAFLIFAHDAIIQGHSGNWSMDLRLAALGQTKNSKEIYSGIQVIIWQVSYLIELFYYSRKNRNRVFILGLIILSFAFLTMSKAAFLEFFIKTICILYFRKKVNLKHILIGFGTLFFLFAVMQAIRYSTKVDSVDKQSFAVQYLISSMSAFDTLMPASSMHWGENVFRFYYSAAYKIGLVNFEPVDTLLPFIKKPMVTNTYTGMYPFFKDFGYSGIVIFSIILGSLYGFIFNKAQKGNAFYIILYSIFIQFILMQYVADMFITSLLAYVKQIILLAIPFWAARTKIFSIDRFVKHTL